MEAGDHELTPHTNTDNRTRNREYYVMTHSICDSRVAQDGEHAEDATRSSLTPRASQPMVEGAKTFSCHRRKAKRGGPRGDQDDKMRGKHATISQVGAVSLFG